MPGAARSERLALCALLDEVGPDAPTLCEGWTTADLAAHLVVRERRPDAAPGIVFSPLAAYTARVQDQVKAATPYPGLIERIRTGPPAPLRPLDDVMNTVEYFTHHEDVRRAAEPWSPRELAPHESAQLWARLGLLGRQLVRHAPVGVELLAPGREAKALKGGPTVVSVAGEPGELVLWACGRGDAAVVELRGPADAVAALRATPLGL